MLNGKNAAEARFFRDDGASQYPAEIIAKSLIDAAERTVWNGMVSLLLTD